VANSDLPSHIWRAHNNNVYINLPVCVINIINTWYY